MYGDENREKLWIAYLGMARYSKSAIYFKMMMEGSGNVRKRYLYYGIDKASEELSGKDKMVLETAIFMNEGEEFDFDEAFSLLFLWCKEKMEDV